MNLGKKIYELRKLNNITQEQLAKAIGVSAPAVCKWETGASMPDIMLAAPIARALNTNLDELFSFHETLSEKEVKEIMDKIKETARKEGLNAAIAMSRVYLKQYPNIELLKLKIAMLPLMMAHTADEEYHGDEEKYKELFDETTMMMKELTHSKDENIRMSATIFIAGRYMEKQRFDDAEAILKEIPTPGFDTRYLFHSLYLQKGEDEKAFEYAQANMLQNVQNLRMDIRSQQTLYLKNKQYDAALKCAEDYLVITQIVGAGIMCATDILVDTYLAMNQQEKAIKSLLKYIEEIKNITGNYQGDFYYSHIADKVVVSSFDVENDVRASLYKGILLNDSYGVLRKDEEVIEKLKELEMILS